VQDGAVGEAVDPVGLGLAYAPGHVVTAPHHHIRA